MRLLAALLAAALPLVANGEAQLLPFGEFMGRDGRPGPDQSWSISDEDGRAIAAQLNAVAAQTPVVIDYDHQTFHAPANGQPAPAAGWIKSVEWRDGVGLFAQVEWTPRAKALIEAKEYAYISPVIAYGEDGRVLSVLNAALVNYPAIVGMDAVVAQLGAFASRHPNHQQESRVMDREQLIAALGLSAGATDQDITAAIAQLRARPAIPAALCSALGVAANADEAVAVTALAALRAGGDARSTQTVAALQAQVATLTAQQLERDVTDLVDRAIAQHKLVPALRDWAVGLGKTDKAQLAAYIDKAPAIAGLAGQSEGKERHGAGGDIDPKAVAVKALAYQTAQLAAGNHVTTEAAVAHVMAAAGQ